MVKRFGSYLLKAGISAGLVALLLSWIPADEIGAAFADINLPLYLGACLILFLQQNVIAYCWRLMLTAQGNHVPIWRILQVHWIGAFFGAFMPTSIGMDLIRAISLSRYMKRGADAMSSMFVTRVIGFLINFIIAIFAVIPLARRTGNNELFWAILVMTILFCGGLWVLLHPGFNRHLNRLLARTRLSRLTEKLDAFHAGIRTAQRDRKALLQLIIYSIFYQLLGIYLIYICGRSLGISLSLIHYFILVPVISTVTVLPLSIAGIGIREGAFVFFFVPFGVAKALAFSLSTLVFAQWLGMALFGGVVYLFSGLRISRKVTESSQPLAAQAPRPEDAG